MLGENDLNELGKVVIPASVKLEWQPVCLQFLQQQSISCRT